MKSVAVILCFLFVQIVWAQIPGHEITYLPGLSTPINFKQYSGYIQVNSTSQRNLFYWFVESQSNPQTDPVVLWLNGGPGCSSLDGFLSEHGPFNLQDNGDTVKLTLNPYSWNKVSNVLYIESPVGVGYSYSANPSVDYQIFNDNQTALDLYQVLQNFFQSYPLFSKQDFYVSGESYAGRYVPVLSNLIHDKNQDPAAKKINLKGFLVGNGITDDEQDTNSFPYFLWQHAIVSDDSFAAALKACQNNFYKNADKPDCAAQLNVIYNAMNGINIYNLYGICEGVKGKQATDYAHLLMEKNRHKSMVWNLNKLKLDPPCIDSSLMVKFTNNPQVKQAIHANTDIKWEICSGVVNRHYDSSQYTSMVPIYQKFLAAPQQYRLLVYSGDIDAAVNVMGSQWSVLQIVNQTEIANSKYVHWSVDDSRQVAGKKRSFRQGQFTFLTVRGAGHMVPESRPKESLTFFSRFLQGKL